MPLILQASLKQGVLCAYGKQAEIGRIVLYLAKSKSCPDSLGLPNDCSGRQSDCKCVRCWYRALRNIQNEDAVQR